MGKETRIICDSCGANVYQQKYFTLTVQKVIFGKQTRNPAIYLCPKCFRETKLSLLLCNVDNEEVKKDEFKADSHSEE